MKETNRTAQAEATDVALFDQLEDILDKRGIDLQNEEIAASFQAIKHGVDSGEIVLTPETLQEIAATIDQVQASEGELSPDELEAVAGGEISPITKWIAGSLGFVVGAAEECVGDFVEASKNLFD